MSIRMRCFIALVVLLLISPVLLPFLIKLITDDSDHRNTSAILAILIIIIVNYALYRFIS